MDIYYITNAVLLALLILTAITVAVTRSLMFAVVMLCIFSLLMAMLYLVMGAADVAITEAAVGAGISTVMLICTLALTGTEGKSEKSNNIVPLLVVLATGAVLIYATLDLPAFGDAAAPAHTHVVPYYLQQAQKDIGIPNVVTATLASYRGYDTFGEVVVIFTAAISVIMLIGCGKKGKQP